MDDLPSFKGPDSNSYNDIALGILGGIAAGAAPYASNIWSSISDGAYDMLTGPFDPYNPKYLPGPQPRNGKRQMPKVGIKIDAKGKGQPVITQTKKKRKKKRTIKSSLKGLSKKVAKLEKRSADTVAKTVYKNSYVGQVTTYPGYAVYDTLTGFRNSAWSQVIESLEYNTFADPAVSDTTDITLFPMQTKLDMKGHIKYYFRNNWNMPIWLDTYWVSPKHDVSIHPDQAIYDGFITDGIAQPYQVASYAGKYYSHPCLYPSDSSRFRQDYHIDDHKKVRLETGEEFIISYSKNTVWDQELVSNEGELYDAKYMQELMIRIQGVPTHDATDATTQIGFGDGGLDWHCCRIIEVEYPSDIATTYTVMNNNQNGKYIFTYPASVVTPPTASPVIQVVSTTEETESG